MLWDGAPYHRAQAVREVAGTLDITPMPLPGYSPDLMPVEALWRWLREDVTCRHGHASADDLIWWVADFEVRINQDPCALADRIWVKDFLDQRRRNYSSQTRRSLAFKQGRCFASGTVRAGFTVALAPLQ